jgi:hypothetical protein
MGEEQTKQKTGMKLLAKLLPLTSLTFSEVHGIKSQKIELSIITAV